MKNSVLAAQLYEFRPNMFSKREQQPQAHESRECARMTGERVNKAREMRWKTVPAIVCQRNIGYFLATKRGFNLILRNPHDNCISEKGTRRNSWSTSAQSSVEIWVPASTTWSLTGHSNKRLYLKLAHIATINHHIKQATIHLTLSLECFATLSTF